MLGMPHEKGALTSHKPPVLSRESLRGTVIRMRIALRLAGAGIMTALLACGAGDPLEAETIIDPYEGSTGLEAISSAAAYPSGPYGVAVGDVLQDATFFGYKDAQAAEAGQLESFSLSDFYDPDGSKGIDALYLSISASWCPPCQAEAKALPELVENLQAKSQKYPERRLRVAFFQDLYEGPTQKAATQGDLDKWQKRYKLPFPVVIDPKAKMSAYFDRNSIPYSLLIDAKTMKILATEAGFDTRKVPDKDDPDVNVYPLQRDFIEKYLQ